MDFPETNLHVLLKLQDGNSHHSRQRAEFNLVLWLSNFSRKKINYYQYDQYDIFASYVERDQLGFR